jgi:hypothetical protein
MPRPFPVLLAMVRSIPPASEEGFGLSGLPQDAIGPTTSRRDGKAMSGACARIFHLHPKGWARS